MTTLAPDTAAVTEVSVARVSRLNGRFRIGLALLGFVLVVAAIGPTIRPYQPEEIVASDSLAAPSGAHWLGADNLGRDIFVRVSVGYRISLVVALGSVVLALLVGVPLGLLAGYGGKALDSVVMRPLEALMAFPAILLAITAVAILGSGLKVLMIAIAIVYVPIIARIMRASTLQTSSELYIEAARARGASHTRILLRHFLPNSFGPVVVQSSILLAFAVLIEAGLSFVGVGVRPPTPSIGIMLVEGREFMLDSPWLVMAPGIALMILVLSFNLIGDGLQAWLDPRRTAGLR